MKQWEKMGENPGLTPGQGDRLSGSEPGALNPRESGGQGLRPLLLGPARAKGAGRGWFLGICVAAGWKRGWERGRKNESESASEDGARVRERERERGMCVRGTETWPGTGREEVGDRGGTERAGQWTTGAAEWRAGRQRVGGAGELGKR